MGQVIVRNLDDAVVAALKRRARAQNRPLEQELREILTAAAKPSGAELRAESTRIRGMTPPGPRIDLTSLIREDRDR